MESPRPGGRGAWSILLLTVAGLSVPATFIMLVLAYFLAALRCDEECEVSKGEETFEEIHWALTFDTWQWNAQLGLALSSFLACIAALVLLIRRKNRLAGALLVAAALSGAAWAAFYSSASSALTQDTASSGPRVSYSEQEMLRLRTVGEPSAATTTVPEHG